MKLLPWICVVGLLIGLGWVYSAGQKKQAELAALREENQQLQTLHAELEEAKNARTQAESDELIRLRKELADMPRLRNEAQQLRSEKQQLAAQVQKAQAQVQGVQEQMQTMRATVPPPPPPGQPNAAVQAALAARPAPEQVQATLCINNLRMIDAAKQQWAQANQKPAGALFTPADIAAYLPNKAVPACPAGGVYTLNQVGLAPICNVSGHSLSK